MNFLWGFWKPWLESELRREANGESHWVWDIPVATVRPFLYSYPG